MVSERIPFEEAISEPLLLKEEFDKLSLPQKVALKVVYGLPLEGEELKIWSIFQEAAEFDALGYPISISEVPYHPREYEEITAIFGRRSGKTDKFSSFIAVYEALLGGHSKRLGKKQKGRIFLVEQNLDHAAQHIQEFILPLIESSPLLRKEITKTNTDGIALRNRLVIAPAYPNIKLFRGFAIPCVVLDEAGFYYKDAESANPDFEVLRSISPAMGQFEHRKVVTVSTPWSKEGILWRDYNAGTGGRKLSDPEERSKHRDLLVLHAPTPAMQNPLLDQKWFEKEQSRDPDAYVREILARFVDSISGLIPEHLLRQAVEGAPRDREPLPRKDHPEDPSPFYVAAMDPAFRHDKFSFTIVHYDPEKGVVQDLIKEWKPSPQQKLAPGDILDEISFELKRFRIGTVFSDQYQLESLQQLALQRGFSIIGIDFTRTSKAKIYGSFLTLLRQGRVKLLQSQEQFQELLALERHTLPGGTVAISAPVGKYDDLASCLVLAISRAIWLEPTKPVERDQMEHPHHKIMRQIERMRRARRVEDLDI